MQGYFVTVNELYSTQYPTRYWYVCVFLLLRDGEVRLWLWNLASQNLNVLYITACNWQVPLLLIMAMVVCISFK